MSKLFFLTIILSLTLLVTGCTTQTQDENQAKFNPGNLKPEVEKQIALSYASQEFNKAIEENKDLADGPCLSNALYGNPDYPETMWVLDIVHNPRQPVDDLPDNQCSAFREGKAKHFIEMDENGNIIKVY